MRLIPLSVAAITLCLIAGCGVDYVPSTSAPAPTAAATQSAAPTHTAAQTASATSPPTASKTPAGPTATRSAAPSVTASSTQLPSATATASAAASASSTAPATPTVTGTLSAADQILSVPQTETWALPGLRTDVQVIRTESNVPHIYGSNRRDVAFVQGFIIARDRYFMMDLTRRLGLGRVTELVGDFALDTDLESRLTGMTTVADRIANGFSPEHAEMADAFAAGVNSYIAQVQARRLPLPTELRLAGPLLGVSNPRTLMEPLTRRDVAGILAVVIYQSSFETGDVGNTNAFANLDQYFNGAPFETLRKAGLRDDVAKAITPLFPVGSSAGFGLETGDHLIPGPLPQDVPGAAPQIVASARAKQVATGAEKTLRERVAHRLDELRDRLGRRDGFGSNAWAVSGTRTASGATLVAGDGHLQLDIPPIFVQIGMDTEVFGGGDIHQLGLTIPGFFVMPVGTNGHVAWSQTQLSADITDWYDEQVQLDSNGLPAATIFQGEVKPLQRVDESYVIREVDALGSVGRTEMLPRWLLFDGRLLTDVEGRSANNTQPGPGESVITTLGGRIIPADVDGDGVISGISVDYSGYDIVRILDGADGFGRSANVEEMRQQARKLIGYSQNIVGGDDQGGILYTSYHAVPCRGYLPRAADGSFTPGAHPARLLDGTRFQGFTIPMTDGLVDETASGGDPLRCLVPFDSTPQSKNPSRGFVLSANNDPDHIGTDNTLENDPWYIGGPWETGFRAHTIETELARTVNDGNGDVARMAAIQANHESRLGEQLAPQLIKSIQHARALRSVDRILNPAEQREVDLYDSDAQSIDEVETRLRSWGERGYDTASGVATFYSQPAADDADDAVATMIFHPWLSRFMRSVWDDEPINGGLFQDGDQTRMTLLIRFLAARDSGGAGGFSSFNPETGESVFFDVLGTPEVETSHELALRALVDALSFLRSTPTAADSGGFGTADMSKWLWGLRHQVRFESLLAPFLGNDPAFALFTAPLAIDTGRLPLAPDLPPSDPRSGLRWFPRPGDQWNVDAGNPGFSGTSFTYGSGPVMRMVFALKDGQVNGQNIIPGGQSGLADSPFFSDQAALWLGNQALPARFHVADVVTHASGREVYQPAED